MTRKKKYNGESRNGRKKERKNDREYKFER
jgi:hypothetical protein